MLNFIRKLLSKLYRKLGISADLGYIGTGVSLPPPLSKEEELRLTLLFTNADDSPAARETAEQAKNTLIEHNLRLVVYIAKKFENTGVCIEDLISIGTIGLIKAVNTFRADRNIKLATEKLSPILAMYRAADFLSKPSTHFARTGTSSLQPTQAAASKMKSLCICAKP